MEGGSESERMRTTATEDTALMWRGYPFRNPRHSYGREGKGKGSPPGGKRKDTK